MPTILYVLSLTDVGVSRVHSNHTHSVVEAVAAGSSLRLHVVYKQRVSYRRKKTRTYFTIMMQKTQVKSWPKFAVNQLIG